MLEQNYGFVNVAGEISNLRSYPSGHWYFTLKDERAEVSCVMFRGQNQRIARRPENGDSIRLEGRLSLYEARGTYQIIVSSMHAMGEGALMLAYERLKRRLHQEGLFDEGRKVPIPTAPGRVALVTSLRGAALQDMLTLLRRRSPQTEVIVVGSAVQGDAAPGELVEALERIQRTDLEFDCIVIGRGGGSIEDLWAFNDERLARTIADCTIPTVSAVGHETDFTIADFVADARAPTPSAAIEMITADSVLYPQLLNYIGARLPQLMQQHLVRARRSLERQRLRPPTRLLQHHAQRLDDVERRMHAAIGKQLHRQRSRLQWMHGRMRHPGMALRLVRQRLDILRHRLRNNSLAGHLQRRRRELEEAPARMAAGAGRRLRTFRAGLDAASARLEAVSPQAVLKRGYALVWRDGELIRMQADVKPDDILQIQWADGERPVRAEDS